MLLQHWGSTPDEIGSAVAGDELIDGAQVSCTRSITIDGPPPAVWPWLVQMGFGRAGWYSYDWIDNLGRRSADRIHPEWQDLVVGGSIPGGPIDFAVPIADPDRAIVLHFRRTWTLAGRSTGIDFTLAFDLRPLDDDRTRLVTRMRSRIDGPGGAFVSRWVLGPGDGVMVRCQLLNIAARVNAAALAA